MFYEDYLEQNKEWIDSVWNKLDSKFSKVTLRSRDKLPSQSDENGVHDHNPRPFVWTNGFWGGLNWLLYEATGNEEYMKTAKRSEELMDNSFDVMDVCHHDTGFIWHLTSGASYKLTGDKASRNRNLTMAMALASRFKLNGGYIRAWNGKWQGLDNDGWTIIDCMMNIPQLYWASAEIGDDRFKQIAVSHADMTMRDHVRADGSMNHIVFHDLQTGEMIGTHQGQGYAVGSTWTRGESWGLYGFVLSYIYTKDEKYLNVAKSLANYTIANLAATDWLTPIDFRAPEEPVLYDSLAGAIFAAGLAELAKHVSEHEQKMYITAALKILKAMEEKFCDWDEDHDSVLGYGSIMYTKGHHMPIIYGDFFFTEAILKLRGSKFLIW